MIAISNVMQGKRRISLDNGRKFHYNVQANGVWRSLVSRLVRVQEASGSNPDTPTKNAESTFVGSAFFMRIRKTRDLLDAITEPFLRSRERMGAMPQAVLALLVLLRMQIMTFRLTPIKIGSVIAASKSNYNEDQNE